MNIKINTYYQGIINGKIIRIVNVSDRKVTFVDVETNKAFTIGRKMFEHCYLIEL